MVEDDWWMSEKLIVFDDELVGPDVDAESWSDLWAKGFAS
jgi:hypothetical protein